MADRRPKLADYAAGLDLLRQEHYAALLALPSENLIPEVHQRRVKELADEYRLRRANEMQAVRAQMDADARIAQ